MSRRSTLFLATFFLVGFAGIATGWLLRNKYEADQGIFPDNAESEYVASADGRTDTARPLGGRSSTAYFDDVRRIVESQYVDKVIDETGLARGALESLLGELRDPGSRYYDPEQFKRFRDGLEGRLSGIGADVAILVSGTEEHPQLPVTIVSVPQGSPAAKAGLKSGDVIEEISGSWVASRSLFDELTVASTMVGQGKLTREEFDALFEDARRRFESMISVIEAIDKLQTNGEAVDLIVIRAGKPLKVKAQRAGFNLQPQAPSGNTLAIRLFTDETPERLREFLQNRTGVILDLRDNYGGSVTAMEECLELLLEPGAYAKLETEPGAPPRELRVVGRGDPSVKGKVLVNSGTARIADVFASALSESGRFELEGGPTFGLGLKIDVHELPDGSGFTLTSGRYHSLRGRPLSKSTWGGK